MNMDKSSLPLFLYQRFMRLRKISREVYRSFRENLDRARTLVYLTDNCGEIVLDKLFIKLLKERYENLQITVIVRGKDVINDATMEDGSGGRFVKSNF